jgi:Secretion system C-terminal sorting domain
MKKLLLFSFLFSLSGMLSAQRWTPVMLNDTFHYRFQNDQVISGSFFVDSLNVNGNDTTFYFNRIGCIGCLVIPNSPSGCDTCYGFRNLSAVVSGYSIIKSSNGVCIIQGVDTAVVNTLAMPGDSWAFVPSRNITALLLSIDTGTVLGQPDSVRVAALSSGDTVIWSAEHGIVKWPAGFGYNRYYKLDGIQNRNIGSAMLTTFDYYDFQPGDIFQYGSNSYSPSSNSFDNRLIKVTIQQRQDYADSIIYNYNVVMKSTTSFNQNSPNWPQIFQYTNTYSASVTIYDCQDYFLNLPNKTVFEPSLSNTIAVGSSQNRMGCVDTLFTGGYAITEFFMDTLGNPGMTFGRSNYPQRFQGEPPLWYPASSNSDTLLGAYYFNWPLQQYDIAMYASFVKGLGLTTAYWDQLFEGSWGEGMIGYYKGTDTVGTIYSDAYLGVGVEENVLQNVKLFPNPANESLRIELAETSGSAQIELINLQGELVQRISTAQAVSTISTSELAAGMYLLRVQTADGVSVQRVVIQH